MKNIKNNVFFKNNNNNGETKNVTKIQERTFGMETDQRNTGKNGVWKKGVGNQVTKEVLSDCNEDLAYMEKQREELHVVEEEK